MGARPAWIVIGAAAVASFAAGWCVAVSAKAKNTPAPTAEAPAAPAPVVVPTAPPQPPPRPVSTGTPAAGAADAAPATSPVSAAAAPDDTFRTKILPFMQKYCMGCHNADKAAGGLTLEGYVS